MQVALIEQIVVIGVLRLQRRVADGKRDGAGRLVFGHIGTQLAGIGTGDAAAINRTQHRVIGKRVTQLHTGQNVQIRRIINGRGGHAASADVGVVRACVRRTIGESAWSARTRKENYVVTEGVHLRTFETDAGLHVQFSEVDGVHRVAGGDALDGVEDVGIGVSRGRLSVQISAKIRQDVARRLIEVRHRPEVPAKIRTIEEFPLFSKPLWRLLIRMPGLFFVDQPSYWFSVASWVWWPLRILKPASKVPKCPPAL